MRGQKRTKNVAIVDKETGKIEYENVILIRPPQVDKNFIKLSFYILDKVLQDKELLGGAFRLLIHIARKLKFNEPTFTLVYDLDGKDLEVSKSTFYRWINILVQKGYIKKIASNVYTIAPNVIVKGKFEEQEIKAYNIERKLKNYVIGKLLKE